MEGVMGGNTVHPNSINKSEVLDVKPVRTLVPIFPEPYEGPPFVCVPPNGPFPSGFSPFFPFSGSNPNPNPNQNDINPTPAPVRPFTAETSNGQNVSPMGTHVNQGQKPAPSYPVKKRGRGRPRTRFP
ncbi:hypothetical protein ERO13_A06G171700v2 [Gossypium hirsutum]|uniref:Uncharacterized protein n=4 Tax=Gossypium TaxID=3633 RepID=A0A5D2YZR0_GOSMU|nr:hypothetical protein ES319_A06G189400v1 [Gossypium barbadense]KAG4196476.1 hypothetical protein ERO13_A06G171700v2 [Gossypium hirsutum]TYH14344.1 hypothetical protein ES288_A06G212900v1 [Gossypium darwinii]TYI24068.1 hypothetical protein ES332_A06G207900v1 [Gossypium tomentosum]TYJ31325.1 hypothetical protein E1A91_A06G190300v1 [Gossypium mustelinum]